MFTPNIKITTPTDKVAQLKRDLEDLKDLQVLVGIPQNDSERADTNLKNKGANERKDGEVTNAELAFLMTNGVRKRSMREEMYSDVQQHGYHKAYDMYVHSHGSPLWAIPPRPIIEPAIEDDKDKISEIMKEAIQAALDGDFDKANKLLNKAGLEGQRAAQDWFTNPDNGWTPNSPTTIEMKGSARPLIDTGQLRKSITYVVRKGE